MISNFHLIRPEFLLLLIPAIIFLIWQKNYKKNSQSLHEIVDEKLFEYVVEQNGVNKKSKLWLPALMLFIALFSISGPTWEKKPLPVFVDQSALIIALDLSQSMLAEDFSPNRLSRAKFIVQDVLNKEETGQFALIAFANEAFVVTPFSDDKATLIQQLHVLHPNIMPAQGTNFLDVIQKSEKLNTNNQLSHARLLIITDTLEQLNSDDLQSDIIDVSILAIGKTEGAPIPSANRQFIKNAEGNIVISKLNEQALNELKTLSNIRIRQLTNSDDELDYLLPYRQAKLDKSSQRESDIWIDRGGLFAWLLLPYFLFFFRKGLVYSLFLMVVPMPQADALTLPNWMLNNDQRAQQAFDNENYGLAAKHFQNQKWKASSLYKKGDFEAAEQIWDNLDDAVSDFNAGNAAVKQKNLDGAIQHYKNALKKQSDFKDAKDNLKAVEEYKKQQQQPKDNDNQNGNKGQDTEKRKGNKLKGANEKQDTKKKQNKGLMDKQDEQNKGSKQQLKKDKQNKGSKGKEDKQNKGSTKKKTDNKEAEQKKPTNGEQKQLNKTQQWLQQIPDDPGGLLRRKFYYYSQENQQQDNEQPW